ncbi:lysine-rich arabinogalactan protein 19-like [Miscanthus floridulus]|uniref:lysine-rich arabinogalactan protein 19-like n=1 Tax=Miscanthus floridulus TaxID=154761 RepID=UPI003458CCC8
MNPHSPLQMVPAAVAALFVAPLASSPAPAARPPLMPPFPSPPHLLAIEDPDQICHRPPLLPPFPSPPRLAPRSCRPSPRPRTCLPLKILIGFAVALPLAPAPACH